MKKLILISLLMIGTMQASADDMSTEIMWGNAEHDHDTKNKNSEPPRVLGEVEKMTADTFGIRQTFSLSDSVAFEMGYHDFGQTSVTGAYGISNIGYWESRLKVDTEALSFGVKSGHTFSTGWALTGRFGLTYWKADVDSRQQYHRTQTSAAFSVDDSDLGLYGGIDIRYPLTNTVSIGLQYTRYDMDSEFKIGGVKLETDSTIENTSLVIGFHY